MRYFMKAVILAVVFGISMSSFSGAVVCNNPFTCGANCVLKNCTDMVLKVTLSYSLGNVSANPQNTGDETITLTPGTEYEYNMFTTYQGKYPHYIIYNMNGVKLFEGDGLRDTDYNIMKSANGGVYLSQK